MPVVQLVSVPEVARTLQLPACVVFIHANWCGYCKRFKPVLEAVAARYTAVPVYCIEEALFRDYKASLTSAKIQHSFIETTSGYPKTYFSVYGTAKAELQGAVDQPEVVRLFEQATAALRRDTAVPCVVTDGEVLTFKQTCGHGAVIQGATYSDIKQQLPVGGMNTTKCIAQIALPAGEAARVTLF